MADRVMFHGYTISADARRVHTDCWTGRYIVEKDGQIIRTEYSVTWRETMQSAQAGALVFGIQFVDNRLLAKRDTTRVANAG